MDLWKLENEIAEEGFSLLCGVDEAGRGPLAGPVYAAAVILPMGLEIPGLNDSKRHGDALIRMLRGLECRVNLIRFHKIPGFPYESSPAPVMEAFRDRLGANGITCTIRASRGEDILAACGMLAGQHGKNKKS